MVVYRDDKGRLWVRPLQMFFECVDVDGEQIPRFSYVDPNQLEMAIEDNALTIPAYQIGD